ncbi:MAG: hypothetical protein JNK89_06240 [Saprospiraceae bacterium]|nr:hypothetical protein [Saprospiraceae bacterium]
MSKKKFSEGLDDLLNDQQPTHHEAWGHATDTPARERKTGNKNFMDDLDDLFHEAFDDRSDLLDIDVQPAAATPSAKSKSAEAQRAPLGGLDALIRQTVDLRELDSDEASGKKRLTVVIDKAKLLQLKTIARLEHTYLKDILVQLIDEYLEQRKFEV